MSHHSYQNRLQSNKTYYKLKEIYNLSIINFFMNMNNWFATKVLENPEHTEFIPMIFYSSQVFLGKLTTTSLRLQEKNIIKLFVW